MYACMYGCEQMCGCIDILHVHCLIFVVFTLVIFIYYFCSLHSSFIHILCMFKLK